MSAVREPDCAAEEGSWCARFYEWTDSDFLARSADTIVSTIWHLIVIIAVALLARFLIHRLITRVVEGRASRRLVHWMRRAPLVRAMPAGPAAERSRQRAGTVASVLRSVSSTVILVIASVMALAEFGVALGPILASAGIIGLAVGFGAQNLVRDFLSGMFMLLEDQYGVGDTVDVGPAVGIVEAVGLRITTLRDAHGTVWYVRNGEILRVGNKSQGYAMAVLDLPLAYGAEVERAGEVARRAAAERAAQADIAESVLGGPEVLGVERLTADGMTLRLTVKVAPGRQFVVQRVLAGAVTAAFDEAGIPRPAAPNGSGNDQQAAR